MKFLITLCPAMSIEVQSDGFAIIVLDDPQTVL
jgi:hypothetical protein